MTAFCEGVGAGWEVDDPDAISSGVGEETAFGDITGVAVRLGDGAGSGDGVGAGFKLGETIGVGPVPLSDPDEFCRHGELVGSAATPGKVDAHHIKATNNTCRRIRQSRLVISRREEA
jgi:hypothetical protein